VDDIVARRRVKIGLVQPNFAYKVDGEFSRDEAIRQLTAFARRSPPVCSTPAHNSWCGAKAHIP
jgi:hypothetical protein